MHSNCSRETFLDAKLMLQKQKAREENRMMASDVENVHQICLDMKYLTQEELEESLKYFNNNERETNEVKPVVSLD